MAKAEHTRISTTQKSALFALYEEQSALLSADAGAYDRLMEIETEAALVVPQSVEEFALKILIADCGGDMKVNTSLAALHDMARQIVAGGPVTPAPIQPHQPM